MIVSLEALITDAKRSDKLHPTNNKIVNSKYFFILISKDNNEMIINIIIEISVRKT